MEDCHRLLILEVVLFLKKLELQVVVGVSAFLFRRSFSRQFYNRDLFSFGLKRLGCITLFIVDSPSVLGTEGSNFLADFLAILAC